MEPADHDHTLPLPWTAFSGELKYEFIAAEIAVEEALSLSPVGDDKVLSVKSHHVQTYWDHLQAPRLQPGCLNICRGREIWCEY